MKNQTYSWRAAPLVGTAVGIYLGFQVANDEFTLWMALFVGGVLGLFSGILIWLLDRPVIRRKKVEVDGETQTLRIEDESEFAHKLLALLSIAVCILPFIGLIFGVGAVIAGWGKPGWFRLVSWVGTVLSAVITIFFSFHLAMRP
jgi:hypothetical protein